MHPGHYRSAIEHAVAIKSDEQLDALAQHLAACERAMDILRAKGYGTSGMSIDALARQVPAAVRS